MRLSRVLATLLQAAARVPMLSHYCASSLAGTYVCTSVSINII
jgi:hypothetical protein